MKTAIRRGFAGLAAAGMLGAGMLMGTGTAEASGYGHNDYDYYSYDRCWDGGFHGFGFGYWSWHHGYWADGWWHHGYWEWCGCYDNHDNWWH
jgi:hypothetical protein